MLDDMRMRKLGGKTQTAYVRAFYPLVAFLQRLPDTASAEDLQRFLLDMVDGGTSPITVNATITGLKFFFDVSRRETCLRSLRKRRILPALLRGNWRRVPRWSYSQVRQTASAAWKVLYPIAGDYYTPAFRVGTCRQLRISEDRR